jgi:hypothetical protein
MTSRHLCDGGAAPPPTKLAETGPGAAGTPHTEKFVELRASGLSYSRIADQLAVSKPTLIAWSKDLATRIANLRAVEQEALYEKSFASKEQRVRVFQELLEKLLGELGKRDLSKLPTEKLFDLVLKYSGAISEERQSVHFQEIEDVPAFKLLESETRNVSWVG